MRQGFSLIELLIVVAIVSGQNCDNKSTGQVTVVDGSVTHQ